MVLSHASGQMRRWVCVCGWVRAYACAFACARFVPGWIRIKDKVENKPALFVCGMAGMVLKIYETL